jgi:pimeloyl-ACP methyl ester carboxylesterase
MTDTDSHLLEASLPAIEHVQLRLPTLGDKPVITYRAAGDEHAPAIVLLHGIGSSSAGYRAQFAALSKNHRVIAWDAPGYGQSSPFAISTPAATDYADALADLMSALGISRATVVGSSWGSVVAATFAARYPAATRALVLSAPNVARGHLSGAERNAARELLMRSAAAQSSETRAAVVDTLLAPNAGPLVREVVSRLRDPYRMGTRGGHALLHTYAIPRPFYPGADLRHHRQAGPPRTNRRACPADPRGRPQFGTARARCDRPHAEA